MSTILAAVISASAVMGGTLAWQSFSQNVTNETSWNQNSGGRIHTDLNGESMHIYVENFMPERTGDPLFARVRLFEYMEVGEDAGVKDESLMNPYMEILGKFGANINDKHTWDVVTYQSNGSLSGIIEAREYFTLENGGSAFYMPTFNKNVDSFSGDINGTLGGPDKNNFTIEDAYKDYIYFNMDGSDGGITELTATATYDKDRNDIEEEDPVITTDENPVSGANIYQVTETHYTKETKDAKVISMKDWKRLSASDRVGSYWVYDEDGWAYWAEPIMPQTATGLLLDRVIEHNDLAESWYYEIDAEAEYATIGEWISEENSGGFYDEGISADGLLIFNTAAGFVE